MKNKTKIQITGYKGDLPLPKVLERLCLLRTARNVGDVETVNNTQLGRLRDQQVEFLIITA